MVTKPTLYRPEMLDKIREWVAKGIVGKEIAKGLGIAESTLYNWKRDIPEVAEAFKQGEEYIVNDIKNALYKRALGYDYQEEIIENGEIKKIVKKHIPGDVTAQQVALYNKLPDEFRAKNHVENLTLIQNNFQISKTKDELQQIEAELKKLESLDVVEVQEIE